MTERLSFCESMEAHNSLMGDHILREPRRYDAHH